MLVLLVGAATFVLWYVADRRAEMRTAPAPVATKSVGPVVTEPPPVQLGGLNEGKTIDFSSGKGVVSDTPEDRAAMEAALREIEEATRDIKFTAEPQPAPGEPKKP